MATVFDVVVAAQNMGVTNHNISSLSSFLGSNEDEFTDDDYNMWIGTMNAIRESFIDDWVAEHYPDKTAGSLTEDERQKMWAWESDGGLPMEARQAILQTHINAANATRVLISQDFDAARFPVFYWDMRH